MAVTYLLSGGVTAAAAKVTAKLGAGATSCRLAVSTASDLSSPTYSAAVAPDANGYVKLSISGLVAATTYYYAVEIDGVLDAARGQFRTFPSSASTVTVAFASCALTASTHKVFTAIKNRAPQLFIHDGDLHYNDIATNDQSLFRAAYDSAFAASTQAALYAAVPLDYMWDDHDFGGDNSDSTAVAKPAAQAVYRQVIPSYTLPAADAVYHSFQIGRVWFIVTDLRSFSDPDVNTDSPTKTMMGATQKQWFKDQLAAAKAADAPLVAWVSTRVYRAGLNTGTVPDNDHWGAFAYERTELADYIKSVGLVGRVCVLAGDAHMLAFDDGYTSDFATGGGCPLPCFQAAALDQSANTRGDNWSGGIIPGGGHYGTLTVEDDGSHRAWVTFRGWSVDATTGVETEVMRYSFAAGDPWLRHPVKAWDGSAWTDRAPVKVWDGSAWQQRPSVTV